MAKRKGTRDHAPAEISRLKRQLGLGRLAFAGGGDGEEPPPQPVFSLANFVRLEKTGGGVGPNGGQVIGADNQATITWQEAQRNIGGGADLLGNRFVVPADRSGIWAVRVALHLSSQTVEQNANYKVVVNRNGSEFMVGNNHASATRAMTARAEDERYLASGDAIQVQMLNSVDATLPNPDVEVLATSHVTFRYLGFAEA